MERDARKGTNNTDLSVELKKIASDKGFMISDNQGGGNCMFHALSEQLNLVKGIQISHRDLRHKVVNYLKNNPKLPDGTELFNFVDEYPSWDSYLTNMGVDGTWGDHVILHGVANCFGTCIHVITSQSHHKDVIINPERDVTNSNRLVLGHLHELHYVSLIPRTLSVVETVLEHPHILDGPQLIPERIIPEKSPQAFQQESLVRSTANEAAHPNGKTNATYAHRNVCTTSPEVQSFEFDPEIVRFIAKVHKKRLEDIETKYHVEISREVKGSKFVIRKRKDQCSNNDYEEACNQFSILYHNMAKLIKKERFTIISGTGPISVLQLISEIGENFPISLELCKDRKNWEICGEASNIEKALKYLENEGVEINRENETCLNEKRRSEQGALDVYPYERSRGSENADSRPETLLASKMDTTISNTERMASSVVVRLEEDINDINIDVCISRSLYVTGFQAGTKSEDLISHFQHKQNGGGDIKRIIVSKKGTAVITFDNPEVAERVLEHPHMFQGSQLMVEGIISKRFPQEQLSCQSYQQDLRDKEIDMGEKNHYIKEITALKESLRSLEQVEQERKIQLSKEKELQSALSAADHRLKEENQEKTALTERLRSLEQRMEEERKGHLSTEKELRLAVSQAGHQLQDKETLEKRLKNLEQQIIEETNRHLSTEKKLREAENSLKKYQRNQSRDWAIQREEVVLNEKIIGRGAHGKVCEGRFRGCLVAVKEIHFDFGAYEHEMSMALRCRHPNLLQFIGATNDNESPLLVTELLDTSLRHVLNIRKLNHGEIVILALDVSKALNYLHATTPCPIIHQDIKSANVLLWKRDDCLRAKLSMYGSTHAWRRIVTANAEATAYSAPEAFTPQKSTKVDVYSFGVLLCEMCTSETPDPRLLVNQIARVHRSPLRKLILGCVKRDPEERPTMSEVILKLEGLV